MRERVGRAVLGLLLTMTAVTQAGAGVGLGLGYAAPAGGFADAAGGGPELFVEYSQIRSDNIEIGGALSIAALGGQEFTFGGTKFAETTYAAAPLVGFARFYANGVENGGIYGGLRSGWVSVAAELTFDDPLLSDFESDETESSIAFGPEIGFLSGRFGVYASYMWTGIEVSYIEVDPFGNFVPETATISWIEAGLKVSF